MVLHSYTHGHYAFYNHYILFHTSSIYSTYNYMYMYVHVSMCKLNNPKVCHQAILFQVLWPSLHCAEEAMSTWVCYQASG